jgi:O-antigen/teichoic acid export membrane protein
MSFLEKYTGMAVGAVSTIVLARLLTPEEIGLYVVVASLVSIAYRIRDFGAGRYLIQTAELTEDIVRSAFTLTLVIAWSIAVLFFTLSPFVAEVFNETTVQQILMVLAINFVIIPFGSVSLALLRRSMQFGTMFKIGVVTDVVCAVTAISLATMGFGAMSLAWASLSGVVATVGMTQLFRPAEMAFRPSLKAWRQITSFGSMSTGAELANSLGNAATKLILGRVLGFTAVGYYSRAEGLISIYSQFFLRSVSQVAFPAYAETHRSGSVLKEPYLLSLCNITGIAWPFFAVLFFLAYPIIRFLFGPQWDAAVPLVQILALAGFIFGLWTLANPAVLAAGRIKDYFRAQLIIHGSKIVLVAVVVSFGLEAVAGAQILVFLIGFFVFYYVLRKIFPLAPMDIFRATWRSLGVAICSAAIPAGVMLTWKIDPNNVLVPLITGTFGAAVGWICGVYLFRHPLCQEIAIAYNWLLGKVRDRT